MIQRIQTIYLAAIIIICAVLCTGTVVNMRIVSDTLITDYLMNLLYLKVYENSVLVSSNLQFVSVVIVSLVIGWTIKCILEYKDLTKQMKSVKLNFLFIFLLFAGVFTSAAMQIPGFNLSTLNFNSAFGIALLIFMMYLNLRSLLLIRKDDKLIKSADRLR